MKDIGETEVLVPELQWGPPGMGGVRPATGEEQPIGSVLQWGPPGMGGVRGRGRRRRHGRRATSMGTSRNGRCEHTPSRPVASPSWYFNGDLPEWEV